MRIPKTSAILNKKIIKRAKTIIQHLAGTQRADGTIKSASGKNTLYHEDKHTAVYQDVQDIGPYNYIVFVESKRTKPSRNKWSDKWNTHKLIIATITDNPDDPEIVFEHLLTRYDDKPVSQNDIDGMMQQCAEAIRERVTVDSKQ